MGLSDVGLSDVGLSDVGLSDVGLSDVGLSDVGLSDVGLSDVGLSDVGLSDVGLPDVGLPDVGDPEHTCGGQRGSGGKSPFSDNKALRAFTDLTALCGPAKSSSLSSLIRRLGPHRMILGMVMGDLGKSRLQKHMLALCNHFLI